MQIRIHRGTLAASMQTACCTEPTLAEIRAYLADHGHILGKHDVVKVSWYGYDDRIDWQTYIVTVNGDAVAFTDEPVTDDKAS